MIDNFNSKDLSQIDINNNFFHYTNKNNLEGIFQEGLQPRIGDNSLYVEKSKKVFFIVKLLVNKLLNVISLKCQILQMREHISSSQYRTHITF